MSIVRKEDCKVSSFEKLEGLEKQECYNCGKRRMYFCYDCRIPMEGVFNPQIKLPCEVDIIKHPNEKNSKSSAIHCKILAPHQTRVFDFPDVFDYRNELKEVDQGGSTVLVFPSQSSVSVEEFVRRNGPIKRLVVLDCTWFQVGMMQKIPHIQNLPCVSLRNYHTAFWRPQHNVSNSCLATIEAIYYTLREYQEYGLQRKYHGELDDLLFWFFHTMSKVEEKKMDYQKRNTAKEQ